MTLISVFQYCLLSVNNLGEVEHPGSGRSHAVLGTNGHVVVCSQQYVWVVGHLALFIMVVLDALTAVEGCLHVMTAFDKLQYVLVTVSYNCFFSINFSI